MYRLRQMWGFLSASSRRLEVWFYIYLAVMVTAPWAQTEIFGGPSRATMFSVTQQFNARADCGMRGDGVTDDTSFLQTCVTSAAANGGVVYIPATTAVGQRYLLTGSISLPCGASAIPVTIYGAGRFATVLRYTGSGSLFQGCATNVASNYTFKEMTLEATQSTATMIDASSFLSATIRDMRCAWAGSGSNGGTCIKANPTAIAQTPFFTTVDNLISDSMSFGIQLDSQQPTSPPNRWQITNLKCLAPNFANTVRCLDIGSNTVVGTLVSGTDIVSISCDQLGAACLRLGLRADRTTIMAIRQETVQGGCLLDIDNAANRTSIFGLAVHAGVFFCGANLYGIRAQINGVWDGGHQWSGASSASSLSAIVRVDDNGLIYDPVIRTFANLPSPPTNGMIIPCSDCTIATPCAGGGAGALAIRIGAQWVCK